MNSIERNYLFSLVYSYTHISLDLYLHWAFQVNGNPQTALWHALYWCRRYMDCSLVGWKRFQVGTMIWGIPTKWLSFAYFDVYNACLRSVAFQHLDRWLDYVEEYLASLICSILMSSILWWLLRVSPVVLKTKATCNIASLMDQNDLCRKANPQDKTWRGSIHSHLSVCNHPHVLVLLHYRHLFR